MRAVFTAAWSTVTALWILLCVLVGQLAAPGTSGAAWWLAILVMAVLPPFAVYALGLGVGQTLSHRSWFRRGGTARHDDGE